MRAAQVFIVNYIIKYSEDRYMEAYVREFSLARIIRVRRMAPKKHHCSNLKLQSPESSKFSPFQTDHTLPTFLS